jgi:hypothetical protein
MCEGDCNCCKVVEEIRKFINMNIDYRDMYNTHTYDFSSGFRSCLKIMSSILNRNHINSANERQR